MKKIYLILLLALPVISVAQPSLTSSLAPPVNSMILYYDANVPNPPFIFSVSGTTNTWDFTTLTPAIGNEDTVYIMDPATLPGSAVFPTATHGIFEGGDNDINMLNINASNVSFLGVIADPSGMGLPVSAVANPHATFMTFPYTYGSSINSNSTLEVYTTGATIGEPTVDSVHYISHLNVNADVVASGNMIIPSGSYPSLLERRVNHNIDSLWFKSAATMNLWTLSPDFPETYIDSAYYWYSDQSLQHYAHALYDSAGLYDIHYYMSQTTTGIDAPSINSDVIAYPNPTTNFLGIRGLNLPAASTWTIYDAAGKLVLQGKYDLNSLNVQTLSKGSYLLKLETPEGEKHQVRFNKN